MENEKTAVVMNDQLGEMAWAFQTAGFGVLCDALVDEKCMNIAKSNLHTTVLKLEEESYLKFPQASLLVGRVEGKSYIFYRNIKDCKKNCVNRNIFGYIEKNLPETIFLEVSKRHINTEEFRDWIDKCCEYGYTIDYRVLKTTEVTGLPVREEHVYVVGTRKGKRVGLDIEFNKAGMLPLGDILDKNTTEEYFSLNKSPGIKYEGNGVYDWKNNRYEKSETVSVIWRVPLLIVDGSYRKLSVNEVARLKGFPEYYFSHQKGGDWLKRIIGSSANALVCKIIAGYLYRNIYDCVDYEISNHIESGSEEKSDCKQQQEKSDDIEGTIMERRYDVFVSSTYEDLVDERKEITQAILECDCMPVGMEMFPASDLKQWDFIKKVIDKSDIYLVIVAGRYGSISEDEYGKRMSYTEMEFDYALRTGKPILAFLHKDINKLTRDKIEIDGEKIEALDNFRNKLRNSRMVKFFTNKDELKANALSSINYTKKQITTGGWVRSEQAAVSGNKEAEAKLLKLQESNEILKLKLKEQMEENEQILQECEKTKVELLKARDRENELALRYEKIKVKVAELVEEVGGME